MLERKGWIRFDRRKIGIRIQRNNVDAIFVLFNEATKGYARLSAAAGRDRHSIYRVGGFVAHRVFGSGAQIFA